MTCYQNKYTFESIGKKPHKYDCLFDYIYEHRNETFSRTELLLESGYVDRKEYECQIKCDTWRGYDCYVIAALRDFGIMEYNNYIKRWFIGPNFNNYYKKLKDMRKKV